MARNLFTQVTNYIYFKCLISFNHKFVRFVDWISDNQGSLSEHDIDDQTSDVTAVTQPETREPVPPQSTPRDPAPAAQQLDTTAPSPAAGKMSNGSMQLGK